LNQSATTIAIADGTVSIDGKEIASVKNARVGIFKGIRYDNYPNQSPNSVGGVS
jgi:3-hydroxyacyl-[acyl-carrier protein] dehydratase / trans-2-decenoyl-[acyl-carrier protein] isomerase